MFFPARAASALETAAWRLPLRTPENASGIRHAISRQKEGAPPPPTLLLGSCNTARVLATLGLAVADTFQLPHPYTENDQQSDKRKDDRERETMIHAGILLLALRQGAGMAQRTSGAVLLVSIPGRMQRRSYGGSSPGKRHVEVDGAIQGVRNRGPHHGVRDQRA